jgi:hypothetical protein
MEKQRFDLVILGSGSPQGRPPGDSARDLYRSRARSERKLSEQEEAHVVEILRDDWLDLLRCTAMKVSIRTARRSLAARYLRAAKLRPSPEFFRYAAENRTSASRNIRSKGEARRGRPALPAPRARFSRLCRFGPLVLDAIGSAAAPAGRFG